MLSPLLSRITKLSFLTSDTTTNRLEAKHGLENNDICATKYQWFIYTYCNLCCH